MDSLETELQKMYDSEIHVDIGGLWDGGIDVSIDGDEVTGNVKTVAEVLPWLQEAIATHCPIRTTPPLEPANRNKRQPDDGC